MNSKMIFPWVCVFALGAALGAVVVSSAKKETELTKLREENQKAVQVTAELEELKTQAVAQQAELTALREDKQELLGLRNQVGKLRDESRQLSKQLQVAQNQAERAQAQAAQATTTGVRQMEQLQKENERLRTTTGQVQQVSQLNACINNLRQIDGAKQQWALEHNKNGEALPLAQDIAPYLKDNVLPTCPAGGGYVLNAVGKPPTCTIPGHALPVQQ